MAFQNLGSTLRQVAKDESQLPDVIAAVKTLLALVEAAKVPSSSIKPKLQIRYICNFMAIDAHLFCFLLCQPCDHFKMCESNLSFPAILMLISRTAVVKSG